MSGVGVSIQDPGLPRIDGAGLELRNGSTVEYSEPEVGTAKQCYRTLGQLIDHLLQQGTMDHLGDAESTSSFPYQDDSLPLLL
jgi:hypothetical protein